MVGHLHQMEPGDRANNLPRLIKDPIVPAQVAGVMVGDRRPLPLFELELPMGDQFPQDQGVMARPERRFRVFISKGMEAMGRRGHHVGNAVFVKKIETLLHLLHKEAQFTHPPGNVSAAGLFFTKDAEIDPGRLKDL